MEGLSLYLVLAGAALVVFGGAYGIFPYLFSWLHPNTDAGDIVARRLMGAAATGAASATSEAPPAAASREPAEAPVQPVRVEPDGPGDDEPYLPVDTELVNDLLIEIGMLRVQIADLRSDLAGLRALPLPEAAPAGARASIGRTETRKPPRASAGTVAELPASLRRNLTQVRGRRSADALDQAS
jgi:hypothetical protein